MNQIYLYTVKLAVAIEIHLFINGMKLTSNKMDCEIKTIYYYAIKE